MFSYNVNYLKANVERSFKVPRFYRLGQMYIAARDPSLVFTTFVWQK